MNKNEIVEYVDHLFRAALCKCGNIVDAQDLVQDTVLAALAAAGKEEIENPEAWLMTVLNRRYYDMLRRKYHKPTVCFDVLAEVPGSGGEYDRIEESEEYEHVRRCLSYSSIRTRTGRAALVWKSSLRKAFIKRYGRSWRKGLRSFMAAPVTESRAPLSR